MAKNTSFTLGEHFAAFVAGTVAEGRYASASEVVRAGLRLLEDQETRLATLRAALIEGENSGPATPFDFDAFLASRRGPNAPAP
jgi:antitoxin ParD1/3/4